MARKHPYPSVWGLPAKSRGPEGSTELTAILNNPSPGRQIGLAARANSVLTRAG